MTLYHFTCDHGRNGLGDMSLTRPNWQPLIGRSLTWFTDISEPDRELLGLTSDSLDCDRTKYRYRVVDSDADRKIEPWLGSAAQGQTPPHVQSDLHRFSDPARWWISTHRILVQVD